MIARGDYQNCYRVFSSVFEIWDRFKVQNASTFIELFIFFNFSARQGIGARLEGHKYPWKFRFLLKIDDFFEILPDFRASALGHARTTCPSLNSDWKVDAFSFMQLKFSLETRWSKLTWNSPNASYWESIPLINYLTKPVASWQSSTKQEHQSVNWAFHVRICMHACQKKNLPHLKQSETISQTIFKLSNASYTHQKGKQTHTTYQKSSCIYTII